MNRTWLTIVAITFVYVSSARGQADSSFERIAKKGIDEVYNLEFEKADEDFTRLVSTEPENPAGHFFRAMVVWWKIMIDIDNEQYDREFCDSLDAVVDLCDGILKRDEDNVNAIFFKGGAIGFKGRLKFHRDDYIAAANAGRKALPLVLSAQELAPTNVDILLGAGMYNYFADVVPEEYPFLKPMLLFIPSGDKKKGIGQLRLASEKGKYAATESAYLLLQIYMYYEKDYLQAQRIALDLHTRYPNNMVFYKYLGRGEVLLNDWQGADRIFTDIVGRAQKGDRGFDAAAERESEYYLGQYSLNLRQTDRALQHLYRCDEISRAIDKNGPSGFMVMANLRIGNAYDLQGRRDLAIIQYQKVEGWKDYKGSVDIAELYLKSPYTQ